MRVARTDLETRDGRAYVVREARPSEAGAILDFSWLVHSTGADVMILDPDEYRLTVEHMRGLVRDLGAEDRSLFLVAAAGESLSRNPGVGPWPREDKPGEPRRRRVSAERYGEEARRSQAQPQPAEASRDSCSGSESIVGTLTVQGGRERKLRHTGELGLAVHPDWRRQGVGRALLAAALRPGVLQLRRVTLRVFATNLPALRLYEGAGFREEGRLRAHVRLGDRFVDEVRMAIGLGGAG